MHLGSHAFGKVISHVHSFTKGLDREVAAWRRGPGVPATRRALCVGSTADPSPFRSRRASAIRVIPGDSNAPSPATKAAVLFLIDSFLSRSSRIKSLEG